MKGAILGIDTSNYTTSAAVCDISGNVIANLKIPLEVKPGERGLRQSDALFAHTKNLPLLFDKVRDIAAAEGIEFLAAGVSARPRAVEGSYMPCFLAGQSAAAAFAAGAGVPLFEFSHQCGHISAALYSSGTYGKIASQDFAAFHVSGGTTEALIARASGDGFQTEIVGKTLDISAGQAVDRIGVMLGLDFPCGAALEKLAEKFEGSLAPYRKGISVSGADCNFSGLENLAATLYAKTGDKSLTSAFVFDYIGRTLAAMCRAIEERKGSIPFLFAGGVMSNKIIRNYLTDFESYFCAPEYAADNAAGIALLAQRKYNSNH